MKRLLLLPFLTWGLACGEGAVPTRPEETGPEKPQRPIRTVITAVAEEILLRDTVELTAEVVPWAAVTVAAETTGRIVGLPVEAGATVRAHAVLARVDDAAARARLEQAEAEVARIEATLLQADRDLARGRELATTQDIAIGDLDRLTLAHSTSEALLAAARAQVKLRRKDLEATVVRSPFAGVISERLVEVGSWISPGAPLLRLVDARRVKVHGAASQKVRARLRPGLPATVRVDALANALFTGDIRLLGQEADGRTGTYRVEVAVENPLSPTGARLLPGMQGTLVLELGARQALVVPRAALFLGAAGERVFVVRDGSAHLVEPELGTLTEDQAEILSGLSAGDRVVTIGQHMLRDGDRVSVEEMAQ